MADSRCFVQFPHPGPEHKPDHDGGKAWHMRLKRGHEQSHRRKFMQLCGEWITADGTRQTGNLLAWGEWEPESDLIRRLNPPKGDLRCPCYLWRPYYVPRNSYRDLHNTDPFIFGDRFLYSNCRQPSKSGLRHLDQGSVIVFGSGREIDGVPEWWLDTVLVVQDFVDYAVPDVRVSLKDWVPATFLDVTGGPLTDNAEQASTSGTCVPTSGQLRLYRGATPNDPVDGMFSFFPAIPATADSGFPRPLVELPGEYFNPRNFRAPKGQGSSRRPEELHDLWARLVERVRDAGLVLGTHADLPERRELRSAKGGYGKCE